MRLIGNEVNMENIIYVDFEKNECECDIDMNLWCCDDHWSNHVRKTIDKEW